MKKWIAMLVAVLLLSGCGTQSSPLTAEDARDIALQHAGLDAESVTALRSVYDRGDREWEVEFRVGPMEYEYEIHGQTGKILRWEKDRDEIS